MAQLTRQHHDLTAMVTLMGDEIAKHMADIQRQVAPDVTLRGWDLAAILESELEQLLHCAAAPSKGRRQLAARYCPGIDPRRNGKTVLSPEGLDPAASAVVKVRGNRADGAVGHIRNRSLPERQRKVLYQVNVYLVVGLPGRKDGGSQIGSVGQLTLR